jgi:hypothetical protein
LVDKPTLYIDPTGLLELCCRPVNMPILRGMGAKHCFIKLADGTTYGGYNRGGRLRPEQNAPDDRCPKDTPDCTPLPGKEDDVRKAWDNLPKDERIYGWDGTSNRTPTEVLDGAGIPYAMPPGAVGTGPMPPVVLIPIPGVPVPYMFPRR